MPRNYPRALNPIPSQMNIHITTTFISCRLNVRPTMTTNLESDSMITSNSSSCNALRATSWWQCKPDANQPQVRTRWSLSVSRPLLLSTKSSPKSLVTWDARNDRSCEAGGGRKESGCTAMLPPDKAWVLLRAWIIIGIYGTMWMA